MAQNGPQIVLLAGPNGAGKSTMAPRLLRGALGLAEFINADVIAQGLSAFNPDDAALMAGRAMLERATALAQRGVSFAFETTLASRSLVRHIQDWRQFGYRLHIVFLWLPDPEAAVARVRARAALGGHGVPEATITRRYRRGLSNLFLLYQELATTWRVYDNSGKRPRLIAAGRCECPARVRDQAAWSRILELAKHA
jgi:predicted ABC-type ATPase